VIYRAYPARRRVILGAALAFAALTAWGIRHVVNLVSIAEGKVTKFGVIYAFAFFMLVWQTALAYLEKPVKITPRKQRWMDALNVVVNVPVYNEDPETLRACLRSLVDQSRPPQMVHVVDDGSKNADSYTAVREWFERYGPAHGVEVVWTWQPNAGKRHAQGNTVQATPQADVYVTVDSDAILDFEAIKEGMKPFADRKVYSVAGMVLTANARSNFLTRFTDLWFVVGQYVDRSSLSTMGSVLVNSGSLALYRAEVLRDNLDSYLNETFFGRGVEFSDDSMLTIYALTKGKAVQQPSAFSFTLMPDNLDHHLRQYIRWMRGAFIRSWWRFKYLPLKSYAFWAHLMGWVQMVLSTAIFMALFGVAAIRDPHILPWLIVIPVAVAYGQGLRYFSYRRSDMTFRQQAAIYALTPVAALWAFFVLRAVRWYAMATCLKTGWGTRQEVEVGLGVRTDLEAITVTLPRINDTDTSPVPAG
jgi:hyaluronan synthase